MSNFLKVVRDKRGSSLLDILIAVFILTVSFVAILGVLQLSVRLVGQTLARIGAVALANEAIEYARSLPYDSVGTAGGIPTGNIPQSETILLNGLTYIRRTLIQYVDDAKDGTGPADANGLAADYKLIKVELSWMTYGSPRTFSVISNIVPKGVETIAGGGTLLISVIDALGADIPAANVHIENNALVPPVSIDTFTNASGDVLFPGSPAGSSYEITVTRSGMSTAQTYDTDAANPNPNPRHLTVVAGATTASTFEIDFLGSKTIRTFSPITQASWEDTFADMGKIFQSASTSAVLGALELAQDIEYEPTGYATGEAVHPQFLRSWVSFSWNEMLVPGTATLYRIQYMNGGNSVPVPDGVFPGNAAGFTTSPVSLASIDPVLYPELQAEATLTTTDGAVTPRVLDWQIAYTEGPIPIPNVPFTLRGNKTIGTTGGGALIYKYNQNLQTNGLGTFSIPALEYDTYTISVAGATGYDVSEACPPQPYVLNPGVSTTTNVMLVPNTAHTLLVVVKSGGAVLSDAVVRLYGSGGIDRTQTTSGCGQTFFKALSQGTVAGGDPYSLSVTLAPYQLWTSTTIDVSGVSEQTVMLSP